MRRRFMFARAARRTRSRALSTAAEPKSDSYYTLRAGAAAVVLGGPVFLAYKLRDDPEVRYWADAHAPWLITLASHALDVDANVPEHYRNLDNDPAPELRLELVSGETRTVTAPAELLLSQLLAREGIAPDSVRRIAPVDPPGASHHPRDAAGFVPTRPRPASSLLFADAESTATLAAQLAQARADEARLRERQLHADSLSRLERAMLPHELAALESRRASLEAALQRARRERAPKTRTQQYQAAFMHQAPARVPLQ